MPGISIKHGVKLQNLQPQTVWAMVIVANVLAGYNYEFVMTSGSEGTHMSGSLHYVGRAFDFRTRNFLDGHRAQILADIRDALGPEFDVVAETDHAHIEWDPDYLKAQKP